MDLKLLGLIGRMVFINVIPFFLVFHLVMQRRKQFAGENYSELRLIAGEIKIVGVLGYFVILSIFFFSIPILRYAQETGYDILLVEPDGATVFLMAFVSFYLVTAGIYLKEKRMWAYRSLMVIVSLLLLHSFFSVLEYGWFSIVPVVLFSYLLYRLKKKSLLQELKHK